MSHNLETLQSLSETELCELVLIPLLTKMGYSEVRYTHGPTEFGKDILYSSVDPMRGRIVQCATVKAKRLTGDVSSNRAIREVFYQVEQALTAPFLDVNNGRDVYVDHVIVVTPYELGQPAIASIKEKLHESQNKISFMDGPAILRRIFEIDPTILASAPDPTRRYLRSLASRILDTTQLTRLGASNPLLLTDIHISGRLSSIGVQEARTLSFGIPSVIARATTSLGGALARSSRAAVIADLGAGKTTLLQMEILKMAGPDDASTGRPITPVLIPLHRLSPDELKSEETFRQAITSLVSAEGLHEFSLDSKTPFRLLLDGFDELQGHHDRVAQYIERLHQEGGVKEIVVTSRPTRVPDLQGFAYWRLEPFSDDDVGDYLSKWFGGGTDKFSRVLTHIRASEEVAILCRTPLFLTMYCILASAEMQSDLPTRRTDVFTRLCDLMLGDWDKGRRVRNEFSITQKMRVLEQIGEWIHEMKVREFGWSKLEEVAAAVLSATISYTTEKQKRRDVDQLVAEIIFRSSLIRQVDTEDRSYRSGLQFAHLSFQEFFCASSLRRKDRSEWRRRLLDDWWRNVMIFVVGMNGTMDGISLPRKKDLEGKSIRLLEYLREAPYTSAEARYEVFALVASEMLYTTRESDSFKAASRGLGDQLAEAIHEIVNKAGFDGIMYNYFDFLLYLKTDKARQFLERDSSLVDRLSRGDLIKVLRVYVSLLEYEHWKSNFEEFAKVAVRFRRQWAEEAGVESVRLAGKLYEDLFAASRLGTLTEHDFRHFQNLLEHILGPGWYSASSFRGRHFD